MSDDRWIWIPNWDGPTGFQHYKDRDPKWIKCYTRLLSKDEYMELTFAERGLLLSIWLEYARSHRALRSHSTRLSQRLGQKVYKRSLESLIHAGFVEIVDSETLAKRKQLASPEKRREEKTTGVSGKRPVHVWQEHDQPPDLSYITGGAA